MNLNNVLLYIIVIIIIFLYFITYSNKSFIKKAINQYSKQYLQDYEGYWMSDGGDYINGGPLVNKTEIPNIWYRRIKLIEIQNNTGFYKFISTWEQDSKREYAAGLMILDFNRILGNLEGKIIYKDQPTYINFIYHHPVNMIENGVTMGTFSNKNNIYLGSCKGKKIKDNELPEEIQKELEINVDFDTIYEKIWNLK